jgi:hypothetical protein
MENLNMTKESKIFEKLKIIEELANQTPKNKNIINKLFNSILDVLKWLEENTKRFKREDCLKVYEFLFHFDSVK